jgi:hypothetical protein
MGRSARRAGQQRRLRGGRSDRGAVRRRGPQAVRRQRVRHVVDDPCLASHDARAACRPHHQRVVRDLELHRFARRRRARGDEARRRSAVRGARGGGRAARHPRTAIEPGSFRTEWAGRSMVRAKARIKAYAPTADAREHLLAEISGRQPGDPARSARAPTDRARPGSAAPPGPRLGRDHRSRPRRARSCRAWRSTGRCRSRRTSNDEEAWLRPLRRQRINHGHERTIAPDPRGRSPPLSAASGRRWPSSRTGSTAHPRGARRSP